MGKSLKFTKPTCYVEVNGESFQSLWGTFYRKTCYEVLGKFVWKFVKWWEILKNEFWLNFLKTNLRKKIFAIPNLSILSFYLAGTFWLNSSKSDSLGSRFLKWGVWKHWTFEHTNFLLSLKTREMHRGIILGQKRHFQAWKVIFFECWSVPGGKDRIAMAHFLLERGTSWHHISKSKKANNFKFGAFTIVILMVPNFKSVSQP